MSETSKAVGRYLQRHAEQSANTPPPPLQWDEVLVIPCYRENDDLINRIENYLPEGLRCLVIIVLNRPANDADTLANEALRRACAKLTPSTRVNAYSIYSLAPHCDILVLDQELVAGANPSDQGVGLARKAGCDLALAWHSAGCINSRWIHCTDADATLPEDYFSRLKGLQSGAAISWPYHHARAGEEDISSANALYELRLHHYVLGLSWANSPYAYHTLGSSISIGAEHYARVGGFPKRSAAEDFYVLNKLAKTGEILKPTGNTITLTSRSSNRVPFGTGPSVQALLLSAAPEQEPLFYHPAVFDQLRLLLDAITQSTPGNMAELESALQQSTGCNEISKATLIAVAALGIEKALLHCSGHSSKASDYLRHFHQWFDGFRTLKFIHALRSSGWADLCFDELNQQIPDFWQIDSKAPSSVEAWLQQARYLQDWLPYGRAET